MKGIFINRAGFFRVLNICESISLNENISFPTAGIFEFLYFSKF
jgi:hypothetical protein